MAIWILTTHPSRNLRYNSEAQVFQGHHKLHHKTRAVLEKEKELYLMNERSSYCHSHKLLENQKEANLNCC